MIWVGWMSMVILINPIILIKILIWEIFLAKWEDIMVDFNSNHLVISEVWEAWEEWEEWMNY